MSSRSEDTHCAAGEGREEPPQLDTVTFSEHGEARKRAPFASVERGRNAPDPSMPVAEFLLFRGSVFLQAIRRVSNDGMDGTFLTLLHPNEAVREVETVGCHPSAPQMSPEIILHCLTTLASTLKNVEKPQG